MKKITSILFFTVLFLSVSCQKEDHNSASFDFEAFGEEIKKELKDHSHSRDSQITISMKELIDNPLKFYTVYRHTDISSEIERRAGESNDKFLARQKKLCKLFMLEEVEYALFFSSEIDTVFPAFPSPAYIRKNNIRYKEMNIGDTIQNSHGLTWYLSEYENLILDREKTLKNCIENDFNFEKALPVYAETIRRSQNNLQIHQSNLRYNHKGSLIINNMFENWRRRIIEKTFYPISGPGFYNLIFLSRTNGDDQFYNDYKSDSITIGIQKYSIKKIKQYLDSLSNKYKDYKLPKTDKLLQRSFVGFSKIIAFKSKYRERLNLNSITNNKIKEDISNYINLLHRIYNLDTFWPCCGARLEFQILVTP